MAIVVLSLSKFALAQGVLYVDADATGSATGDSWENAFPQLQLAIEASLDIADPVEVWVAQGVYTPASGDDNRDSAFVLTNKLTILGGFAGDETTVDERDWIANSTILSGDLLGNDDTDGWSDCCDAQLDPGCPDPACQTAVCAMNPECCEQSWSAACAALAEELCSICTADDENSFHVVVGAGLTGTCTLDGLIITGGNANECPQNCAGGGMSLQDSNPNLRNCTFTLNATRGAASTVRGGAVFMSKSSPVFENCAFVSNAAVGPLASGGAVAGLDSAPSFENCRFEFNTAGTWGGAMYLSSSSARVIRSTFDQNEALFGGGMYSTNSGSSLLIANCDFRRNVALSAGGGWYGVFGSGAIVNSIFAGNTTGARGAAIRLSRGTPTIANCTIFGNQAGSLGGGIHVDGSFARINNNILWANTSATGSTDSAQIHVGSGAPVVSYNVMQDLPDPFNNSGNVGSDPQFVDSVGPDGLAGTDDDDLQLAKGSPAIDAGSNPEVPLDAFDLDGDGNVEEILPMDRIGEPRFRDDGQAVDTGVPFESGLPAGIVDKGAFERQVELLADVDADGDVDLADFFLLLNCWGGPANGLLDYCPPSDLDQDGHVGVRDLAILQREFGTQ